MNDIIFRTDIFERTYGLLVGEIKDPELQPNWQKVVEIFTTQWQEIENVFKDLNTDRWLDTATGRQLDLIGTIVGRERKGLSDADYLIFLKFQIEINRSYGQPEIILKAMLLLTGATRASLFEEFPAAMFGFVNAEIGKIPSDIVIFLDRLSLGGVRFLYLTVNHDPEPFTHAYDPEGLGYAGIDAGLIILTEDAGAYSTVLQEDR